MGTWLRRIIPPPHLHPLPQATKRLAMRGVTLQKTGYN